jgi:FkbM family methyltransferase
MALVTFDADPKAEVNAESLTTWRSVKMYNCAVSGKDGSSILHLTASPTLTSMQQPIAPDGTMNLPLGRCDYLIKEGLELKADIEVLTRSVDSLCAEGLAAPNWLTIDAQGHEMEILLGAQVALSDSVIGLTVEVSLVEMYDQSPGFSEIHGVMTLHGFDLIDIRPIHAHRSREPFAWRGQSSIVMADLTYVRTMDCPEWSLPLRYIHAFVALIVGCTDTALRILHNLKQFTDSVPDLGSITHLLGELTDLGTQLSPNVPQDWLNITSRLLTDNSDWQSRESNEFLMVCGSKEVEALFPLMGSSGDCQCSKAVSRRISFTCPGRIMGTHTDFIIVSDFSGNALAETPVTII